MGERKLGLRCQAQQIVLGSSEKFSSWLEMGKRIKEVEQSLRNGQHPNPM